MNNNFFAENSTTYSPDIYHKLNMIVVRKRIRTIIIVGLVLCLIGTLMIGFNFFRTLGYIYLGCTVVICVIALLRLYLMVKKAIKRNAEVNKDITINYTFYDNYFLINLQYANNDSKQIEYKTLIKVEETKECIFMFVSEQSALCMYKNSFTFGNWEKVVEVLKLNCSKYKGRK